MKVILIDDERLALDYLERQLSKISDVHMIGKFENPLIGKEKIILEDVDVVFLDIHLPEMNGIELAERILEAKPHLNIVFVTAYDEYAVKAFELNALDYVVKPIRMERLMKTMQRIRERTGSKEKRDPMADRPIRMHVFQQVMLEASEGEMSTIHWRTSKAQELFLYLLQYRGKLVRKSVLTDLLWPESDPDKAYSQLYTAIYHIRKTLECFGTRFQISNAAEGYILGLHQVSLDIDEFEMKINAAPPLSAETALYYAETVKLYTGDYLQEYDYWWAEGECQRLKTLWLRFSILLAEWYKNSGWQEDAIALYLEICSKHPLAEEAYYGLMQIHSVLGNHLAVSRQYRLLTDVLQEQLDEKPSLYITQWYIRWKETVAES